MTTKFKSAAFAASLLACAAVAAPAAAGVVVFDNVHGSWSAAVPGSGISIDNDNPTSTVSWGNPTINGHQSSYSFTGSDVTTPNIVSGGGAGPFQLGEFQHNNWPITGTSLSSVNLTFSADIWIDGNDIGTKSFEFTFYHHETPNGGNYWGQCAYGGQSGSGMNLYGCADKVSVETNALNNQFTFGADTYTLDIAGFYSGGVLSEDFLTQENGLKTVEYWEKTKHGWKKKTKKVEDVFPNKAYIMGEVSMITSAVPEPATWAMMLVGFFGAGTMIRSTRRRTAAAA